jgi:hypothetical protein
MIHPTLRIGDILRKIKLNYRGLIGFPVDPSQAEKKLSGIPIGALSFFLNSCF